MKKILFNDKYGLTQAVLEGIKTQTRRIIKTSDAFERVNPDFDWDDEDIENWENDFALRVKNMSETEKKECFNYLLNHPKYKVGEIVAVAQSYKDVDSYYSAAYQRQLEWDGVAHKYYVNYDKTNGSKIYFKASPKESYAVLIDKVSGKGTWESNPYVFVYDFNLVK